MRAIRAYVAALCVAIILLFSPVNSNELYGPGRSQNSLCGGSPVALYSATSFGGREYAVSLGSTRDFNTQLRNFGVFGSGTTLSLRICGRVFACFFNHDDFRGEQFCLANVGQQSVLEISDIKKVYPWATNLDSARVSDIDECQLGLHTCGERQLCQNAVDGLESYRCLHSRDGYDPGPSDGSDCDGYPILLFDDHFLTSGDSPKTGMPHGKGYVGGMEDDMEAFILCGPVKACFYDDRAGTQLFDCTQNEDKGLLTINKANDIGIPENDVDAVDIEGLDECKLGTHRCKSDSKCRDEIPYVGDLRTYECEQYSPGPVDASACEGEPLMIYGFADLVTRGDFESIPYGDTPFLQNSLNNAMTSFRICGRVEVCFFDEQNLRGDKWCISNSGSSSSTLTANNIMYYDQGDKYDPKASLLRQPDDWVSSISVRDLDECSLGYHECRPDQVCENLQGLDDQDRLKTYQCRCNTESGFEKSGTGTSENPECQCAAGKHPLLRISDSAQPRLEYVCVNFTQCDSGQHVTREPTSNCKFTDRDCDRKCSPVPSGYYANDETGFKLVAHSDCEAPFEYLVQEGTAVTDTVCERCPDGSFVAAPNSKICSNFSVTIFAKPNALIFEVPPQLTKDIAAVRVRLAQFDLGQSNPSPVAEYNNKEIEFDRQFALLGLKSGAAFRVGITPLSNDTAKSSDGEITYTVRTTCSCTREFAGVNSCPAGFRGELRTFSDSLRRSGVVCTNTSDPNHTCCHIPLESGCPGTTVRCGSDYGPAFMFEETGAPSDFDVIQTEGYAYFHWTDRSQCESAFSFTRNDQNFMADYRASGEDTCNTEYAPELARDNLRLLDSRSNIGRPVQYCIEAVNTVGSAQLGYRSAKTCVEHVVAWESGFSGRVVAEHDHVPIKDVEVYFTVYHEDTADFEDTTISNSGDGEGSNNTTATSAASTNGNASTLPAASVPSTVTTTTTSAPSINATVSDPETNLNATSTAAGGTVNTTSTISATTSPTGQTTATTSSSVDGEIPITAGPPGVRSPRRQVLTSGVAKTLADGSFHINVQVPDPVMASNREGDVAAARVQVYFSKVSHGTPHSFSECDEEHPCELVLEHLDFSTELDVLDTTSISFSGSLLYPAASPQPITNTGVEEPFVFQEVNNPRLGCPIQHARVCAHNHVDGQEIHCVKTDHTGSFTFAFPPGLQVELSFEHYGHQDIQLVTPYLGSPHAAILLDQESKVLINADNTGKRVPVFVISRLPENAVSPWSGIFFHDRTVQSFQLEAYGTQCKHHLGDVTFELKSCQQYGVREFHMSKAHRRLAFMLPAQEFLITIAQVDQGGVLRPDITDLNANGYFERMSNRTQLLNLTVDSQHVEFAYMPQPELEVSITGGGGVIAVSDLSCEQPPTFQDLNSDGSVDSDGSLDAMFIAPAEKQYQVTISATQDSGNGEGKCHFVSGQLSIVSNLGLNAEEEEAYQATGVGPGGFTLEQLGKCREFNSEDPDCSPALKTQTIHSPVVLHRCGDGFYDYETFAECKDAARSLFGNTNGSVSVVESDTEGLVSGCLADTSASPPIVYFRATTQVRENRTGSFANFTDHDEFEQLPKLCRLATYVSSSAAVDLFAGPIEAIPPFTKRVLVTMPYEGYASPTSMEVPVVLTGTKTVEEFGAVPFPNYKPLIVLHDPPGGSSYATYSDVELQAKLKVRDSTQKNGYHLDSKVQVGIEGEKDIAKGLAVSISSELTKYKFLAQTQIQSDGMFWSIDPDETYRDYQADLNVKFTYQTSSLPTFAGKASDVYLMPSLTIALSNAETVAFNMSACTAFKEPSQAASIKPSDDTGKGFYFITHHEVETAVIPDLENSIQLAGGSPADCPTPFCELERPEPSNIDIDSDGTPGASTFCVARNRWICVLKENDRYHDAARQIANAKDSSLEQKYEPMIKRLTGLAPSNLLSSLDKVLDPPEVLFEDELLAKARNQREQRLKDADTSRERNEVPSAEEILKALKAEQEKKIKAYKAILEKHTFDDRVRAESNRFQDTLLKADTTRPSQYNYLAFYGAGGSIDYDKVLESTRHEGDSSNRDQYEANVKAGFGANAGGGFSSLWAELDFMAGYQYHESIVDFDTTINEHEGSVGFHLEDPDPGDYFVLGLWMDQRYQTPLFHTIRGASLCVHESGTDPRVQPRLSVLSAPQTDILPDQVAIFLLEIANDGLDGDANTLMLELDAKSLTQGIQVRVDGAVMTGSIMYHDFPGQSKLEVTVEVSRGPVEFEYPPLRLSVREWCGSSPLDRMLSEVSSTVELTTHPDAIRFLRQCSQVAWSGDLLSDGSFLVNMASDQAYLTVTARNPHVNERRWKSPCRVHMNRDECHAVGDGDRDGRPDCTWSFANKVCQGDEWFFDDRLQSVTMEYRVAGSVGPGSWRPAVGSRGALNFIASETEFGGSTQRWRLPTADGAYEIRLVATCELSTGGPAYDEAISEVLTGVIDRRAPHPFSGFFEPADGEFVPGDSISVRFTEDIVCDDGIQVQVVMEDDVTYSLANRRLNKLCIGTRLLIGISPTVDYAALAGKSAQVHVQTIRDRADNVNNEPIVWGFVFAEVQSDELSVSLTGIQLGVPISMVTEELLTAELTLNTIAKEENIEIVNIQRVDGSTTSFDIIITGDEDHTSTAILSSIAVFLDLDQDSEGSDDMDGSTTVSSVTTESVETTDTATFSPASTVASPSSATENAAGTTAAGTAGVISSSMSSTPSSCSLFCVVVSTGDTNIRLNDGAGPTTTTATPPVSTCPGDAGDDDDHRLLTAIAIITMTMLFLVLVLVVMILKFVRRSLARSFPEQHTASSTRPSNNGLNSPTVAKMHELDDIGITEI